jgi:hypothetical protein
VERKEVLRLLWWLFVVGSLIFFFAFFTQLNWKKDPAEAPFFWLQMFSGSSWPTWKLYAPRSPFIFALGVSAQVMLSAGPLLGILWLVYQALLQGNPAMTLAKLMELHDVALMTQVKSYIRNHPNDTPDQLNKAVDDIFAKSRAKFRSDLELVLGSRKAARALEQLETPQ